MTTGSNLENGEKTRYTYNALYMRTARHQTLTGKENYYTKETAYLPDYLGASNNDLMAYEKGFGATRTIYGRAYERLSQKVTSGEVGTGPEGNGTGAALPVNRMPASAETLTPEAMIGASVIGKTYFQPDLYGSPLFASNEQGQVLRYAERNIWGDLKLPIHNDLNLSGLEDSLGFTSYIYDPAIGTYFAHARFYDSSKGRMLSKDPIKRGLNGYHYCDDDPVNYVDPTGEIVNILVGGALGGLTGGLFGFGGSAISQLLSGEKFSYRKAWGAAANGAVAGAAKGAVISSGVGLPLAALADFAAGTAGSALEQWISEGEASARKSITSGLTNAVSGAIYGNTPLSSVKQALGKGAASGAVTSGIDYLSSLFEPQADARRSLGIEYQGGADGRLIPRDPKRGCGTLDPTIGSLNYGKDYGYQYHVPSAEETTHRGRRFSLIDFIKETVTGAVTGGLASATFYGAGKAVEALKESIRNLRNPETRIPLDLQFFAEDGNKGGFASVNNRADYYVKPNGEAVPAVGYRYMPRDAGYIPSLKNTMEISARADGTYISFNKFDTPAPEILQVPHDASIRGSFDTLQIIDDIRIPKGIWGEASWLEPITKDYPQYGPGGATQAITNQKIKLDSLIDLLK